MPSMSQGLAPLVVAMVLFVGTHIVLPDPQVRRVLVRVLREKSYLAAYSVLSIGLLAWVVNTYKLAPHVEALVPNTGMRHASLTVMLVASFFLVCGFAQRNPSTVPAAQLGWKPEAKGIFKMTRHPVMWGVALWGVSHALANGHAAALILFGGMALLALAGAWHLDRRKRLALGEDWLAFEAATSFVPLGAIVTGRARMERGDIPWWQSLLTVIVWVAMLFVHAWLGRDVFPLHFA
ncbi:MAG: NnrU family protein [Rhodospirillaceae bacterium]